MKKIYIVIAISVFLTLNFYTNVLAGNEEEVFKTEIKKIFESWRTANLNADFDLWFSNWDENAIKKVEGTAVILEGTFLTVFKKQSDGSWKIYRDCMMSK